MTLSFFGRNSRAYTLVQLSIEEVGKSLMLQELSTFKKHENTLTKFANETFDEKLERIEKIFFDHPGKTEESLKFMIAMIRNRFLEIEKEDSEIERIKQQMNPKELNKLKNLSLYVDISNGSFEIPYDTISDKQFEHLQGLAHSILWFSKKYVFKNKELLTEIGADPKLIMKLDPYSQMRRLNACADLNKYYAKATIDW
jgi:AbiV family abortive infection protein